MRLACSLVWALAGLASSIASSAASATRICPVHILFFIGVPFVFLVELPKRGREMVPECFPHRRECIHNPGMTEVMKQLLCQTVVKFVGGQNSVLKTVDYVRVIRAFRNRDMSSDCRHLSTAIMTGGAKSLIDMDEWAVAESRQADVALSQHDNPRGR